jgi:hypothetical protein
VVVRVPVADPTSSNVTNDAVFLSGAFKSNAATPLKP